MALNTTTPVSAARPLAEVTPRPRAAGKFLYVGDGPLWIRGITYGPFRPREDGTEYPAPDVVGSDFDRMAAHGFNVVRTYTVPPLWLLDAAQQRGLRVLVGLPWEQHIAFLDDRARARDIVTGVRAGVRRCAGHPAILGYAVGNEIPAAIVRWHGARRIERYIRRLYGAAKEEDPGSLVTYVNYPTTEYLDLPFLDLVCFNVYLESQSRFESYVSRLQSVAGDRPLVLAEIGCDTASHGPMAYTVVAGQVRAAFAAGCAGVCVFAWTDEWHRGGYDIEEWAFGLTDRDRVPKPGMAAVCATLRDTPFARHLGWPRISVVVCSRNGARTIGECLAGLRRLEYPDYEVIVVDDGSVDDTAAIARAYGVKTIDGGGAGLSAARNAGLAEATGEIVAYLDDDASPEAHWLHYLATTFAQTAHAAVGGPNRPPAGAAQPRGVIEECLAVAPGTPTHVMLTDDEAEHVPGCNMAFRRASLESIGGFDRRFRVAGDDVDVCWRIQGAGGTLGFSPTAVVWHRRRDTIPRYWKQQVGYGTSEALLEQKWPQKYNAAGHLTWRGRVYEPGTAPRRGRIYHGTWGLAPYQSLYAARFHPLWSLPSIPEWYLVVAVLAGLSALGAFWAPLRPAIPLLVLAVAALGFHAATGAVLSLSPQRTPRDPVERAKRHAIMTLLHLIHPAARLYGRVRHGLTPWRRHRVAGATAPWPRLSTIWSERWKTAATWLETVEHELQEEGAVVLRGGDFDEWDLEVRGGALGGMRLRLAIEEHGAGRQRVLLRSWPRFSVWGLLGAAGAGALAAGAAGADAWGAAIVLGAAALWLSLRVAQDTASATAAFLRVVTQLRGAVVLRVAVLPWSVRTAPW
ncbi:MAG TPA: glycosyltransferase [bacterium]|nr:glycosyltransferase [bacterium]